MSLIIQTLPDSNVLPITLQEAKANLVVEHSNDDALITRLIHAAADYVQNRSGFDFVSRTYQQLLTDWPVNGGILLERAPLLEVVSITYTDVASSPNVRTLASTVWAADLSVRPNEIYLKWGQVWPVHTPVRNGIVVTFRAGLIDTAASPVSRAKVPPGLVQAIHLIVADSYKNREASIVGVSRVDNPAADLLIDQSRCFKL